MAKLTGRVAVVTGGGRGLGREHALLLAAQGADVVVNDVGGGSDGAGGDDSAARGVVEEIVAAGGRAVANSDSVSDWAGARRIVETAVEEFGDLHIVVNNAGILRDRPLVTMSESEFDSVVEVHLKGTFAVTRHAAEYWRARVKRGVRIDRSLVNTSSGSGLHGNPGQANYGAAKAGIAALTLIAAQELERYRVRVNCIAPVARTRLTEATPGLGQVMVESIGQEFDIWHPANISPLIGVLAAADCPFTGQVFRVLGGMVGRYEGWSVAEQVDSSARWTVDELAAAMATMPARPEPPRLGSHMAAAARNREEGLT
ncbi:SDR family oxidoreductase [Nocardia brevicatena]|uniref:SDR family oxidoreductase n=1 Tax=Nocardia brevicatena TaxID=37327 RepID=UPI000315A99F|nr:SDR family oxidoreductase [Nocardia brevicatena]